MSKLKKKNNQKGKKVIEYWGFTEDLGNTPSEVPAWVDNTLIPEKTIQEIRFEIKTRKSTSMEDWLDVD